MKYEIVIPRRLKVGGLNYTIHTNGHDLALKGQGDDADHSQVNQKIRISTQLMPQQVSLVYIHEIIHAIDYAFNSAHRLDESSVESLANGFLQVLEQHGIRFVAKS